jgi:hypothetical protein
MDCLLRPRDLNAVCHIHSLYCYEKGLLLEKQRFERHVLYPEKAYLVMSMEPMDCLLRPRDLNALYHIHREPTLLSTDCFFRPGDLNAVWRIQQRQPSRWSFIRR